MSSYPKWVYHRSEPARVVENAIEHLALGDGWVESPADVDTAPTPEPDTPARGKKKTTVN